MAGRGKKLNKVKRGGPKKFTPSRILRAQGEESDPFGAPEEPQYRDRKEIESSDEEEEEQVVVINPKLGNTVVEKTEESEKEEEIDDPSLQNSNRVGARSMKPAELREAMPLNRRER